jgi:hypothetical protein
LADVPAPKPATVMDFELIDHLRAYERSEALAPHDRKIALLGDALRRCLGLRGMHRIADNTAIAGMTSDL